MSSEVRDKRWIALDSPKPGRCKWMSRNPRHSILYRLMDNQPSAVDANFYARQIKLKVFVSWVQFLPNLAVIKCRVPKIKFERKRQELLMNHSEHFSVLIVGNELNAWSGLANELVLEADVIETAADANEALTKFAARKHEMVLIDLQKYSILTELELLERIMQSNPQSAVIVITANGNVEARVNAMKAGAFDWIAKPVDLNFVRQQVRKARQHYQLQRENQKTQVSHQNGQMCNSLAKAMDVCEKNTIQQALETCHRHRENTAKMLGISVRSLHYKMRKHGIH